MDWQDPHVSLCSFSLNNAEFANQKLSNNAGTGTKRDSMDGMPIFILHTFFSRMLTFVLSEISHKIASTSCMKSSSTVKSYACSSELSPMSQIRLLIYIYKKVTD